MLMEKVKDEAEAEADAEMLELREVHDITKVSDKDDFSDYYKLMQIEESATVKEVRVGARCLFDHVPRLKG